MQSNSTTLPAWSYERYTALQQRLIESKRLIDAANALPGGIPGPCLLIRSTTDDKPQVELILIDRGTIVGRSSEADIPFTKDDDMSRQHFRLLQETEGDWYALDMDSTNGLWVNDNRVTKRPLQNGDKIHAGRQDFVFHGGTAPEA